MTAIEKYAHSYLKFLNNSNIILGVRFKYKGNKYIFYDALSYEKTLCLIAVNEYDGARLFVYPNMFSDIIFTKTLFGRISRRNVSNLDVLQNYTRFVKQLRILEHYHVGALYEQKNRYRGSDYYVVLRTYEGKNEPIGVSMYVDNSNLLSSEKKYLKKFLYEVENQPTLAQYYLSDVPFYGELEYVGDIDKIGKTPLESYVLKLQLAGIIS